MENKISVAEIKKKLGLDKFSCITPPEDYSSIVPDKYYYVIGDGGMLGSDVIKRKITMSRVQTWKEHKERVQRGIELMKKEKQERDEQSQLPEWF